MVGEAGGGFIFDTNALHRGEVDGHFERNTVRAPFSHMPPGARELIPKQTGPNLR